LLFASWLVAGSRDSAGCTDDDDDPPPSAATARSDEESILVRVGVVSFASLAMILLMTRDLPSLK
jgi:hypothetical protein